MYITRQLIIEEACKNLLREMYRRAQPPVDIEIYNKCIKLGILGEKDKVYEWHYLPDQVQQQIVKDYLEAYNATDWFEQGCNFLVDIFKNGGYRSVRKDIFGTGELIRTGEETEKLDELIGSDNADKVYKLIEDFLGFYNTHMDERAIRNIVLYGPTSNPKTVIEKWGITIDDSVYKGPDGETWDYTYKDYIDGKISEDSIFYEDMLYETEEESKNKESD